MVVIGSFAASLERVWWIRRNFESLAVVHRKAEVPEAFPPVSPFVCHPVPRAASHLAAESPLRECSGRLVPHCRLPAFQYLRVLLVQLEARALRLWVLVEVHQGV